MKTWVRLSASVLVLGLSTGVCEAGIYLGSDATVPQEYKATAPRPKPHFKSPTAAPMVANCLLDSRGKPLPGQACSHVVAHKGVAHKAKGMQAGPPHPYQTKSTSSTIAPNKPLPALKLKTPWNAKAKPAYSVLDDGKIPFKMPKAYKAKPEFSVVVHKGSLEKNVERIVRLSHDGWRQVIWKLPYDYNWVGTARFRGKDLQEVLSKLLAPYPVQAVFYEKNHIVAIVRRRRS